MLQSLQPTLKFWTSELATTLIRTSCNMSCNCLLLRNVIAYLHTLLMNWGTAVQQRCKSFLSPILQISVMFLTWKVDSASCSHMMSAQKTARTFTGSVPVGKGCRKNADCCWQAVGGVNVVDCLPSQQPAWWSPLIAFVCWKTLSFSHFLLVFYSHSLLSPCWPSASRIARLLIT